MGSEMCIRDSQKTDLNTTLPGTPKNRRAIRTRRRQKTRESETRLRSEVSSAKRPQKDTRKRHKKDTVGQKAKDVEKGGRGKESPIGLAIQNLADSLTPRAAGMRNRSSKFRSTNHSTIHTSPPYPSCVAPWSLAPAPTLRAEMPSRRQSA